MSEQLPPKSGQLPPKYEQMVSLWQQMGTSTGSFAGQVIGRTAQYGLLNFNQAVINPLKQYSPDSPPSEEGSSGVREQTWEEMGRNFGESLGIAVGTSMDLLIDTLEKTAATAIPGFKPDNRAEDKI